VLPRVGERRCGGAIGRLATVMAAVAVTVTAGCSYVIEGKVVTGGHAVVVLVEPHNTNLDQPGLSGAMVELTLDPGTISPRALGTQVTDASGRFRLPIDATGAGLLEYEVGILCRHRGYRTIYQTMSLPPKNRRLLIVMAAGASGRTESEDLISETLRLGGQRDPR